MWRNVFLFTALHIGSLIGLYQLIFVAQWKTVLFTWLCYVISGLGITAGAHRLWAHRSYKAKTPLRIILAVFQTMALQNDVIEWARDHRGHHKWSDTNADPHNSTNGFFFSHIGWLLYRKHPDVKEKGKTLDMADLYNDPVLQFQHKYYKPATIFMCFILPTILPVYCWGESALVAFYTCGLLKYCYSLHCTWMVNSVAHKFGNRPYDKNIVPRQNMLTAIVALGEGWHNYHHSFPYDYKTAETPYTFNFTTVFIDAFGLIGWAYDRKSVSHDMIKDKKNRTGDGEHQHGEHEHEY